MVPGPRRETRNKLDILMIVLCTVRSGVEDRVGMVDGKTVREAVSGYRA